MKKILKFLLYLVLVAVLIFGVFLIIAAIKDYTPEPVIVVEQSETSDELTDSLEFSVLVWNIGYCGLGEDMDFFYDGGKQVRSSEENVKKNLAEITSFLKSNDSINFFLLQEVDKQSKRSYEINQVENLQKAYSNYKAYFGKNYDVFFVPQPLTEPYGNVKSGLLTLSEFQPKQVARHAFTSSYGFPMKYFMLDRCFLVSRYRLNTGKELLIINTHNSAYDDGSMRAEEMNYLKDFLVSEYEKGNYVIVGGDWNQSPPKLRKSIPNFIFDDINFVQIKEDYLPKDWNWVFANDVPTNRRVYEVWNKQTTRTTIIDYFLISPNIENISIKNIDLNFQYSDHQPIIGKFKLLSNN